jgi:hypothetical protein
MLKAACKAKSGVIVNVFVANNAESMVNETGSACRGRLYETI